MEITKKNLNAKSINWVTVYLETEQDCNPFDGEYSLSLNSFMGSLDIRDTVDGSDDVSLIKECIEKDLDFSQLPEEGTTEIILKESGEWEDVFWHKYYLIERITVHSYEENPLKEKGKPHNNISGDHVPDVVQENTKDYEDYEVHINGKCLGSIQDFKAFRFCKNQVIIAGNMQHRVPGRITKALHIKLKEESIRDKVLRETSNDVNLFGTKISPEKSQEKTKTCLLDKLDMKVRCKRTQCKIKKTSPTKLPSVEEIEVSSKVKRVIGSKGVARITEFKTLEDGWDFGYGKKLSKLAVDTLNNFFQRFTLDISNVSVFLTNEGHIRLEWENSYYGEAELEFGPTYIFIYFENLNIENSFTLQYLTEEFFKKTDKIDLEENKKQVPTSGFIQEEPPVVPQYLEDLNEIVAKEIKKYKLRDTKYFLRPVIRKSSRDEWKNIKLPEDYQKLNDKKLDSTDNHLEYLQMIILIHGLKDTNKKYYKGIYDVLTTGKTADGKTAQDLLWDIMENNMDHPPKKGRKT